MKFGRISYLLMIQPSLHKIHNVIVDESKKLCN